MKPAFTLMKTINSLGLGRQFRALMVGIKEAVQVEQIPLRLHCVQLLLIQQRFLKLAQKGRIAPWNGRRSFAC